MANNNTSNKRPPALGNGPMRHGMVAGGGQKAKNFKKSFGRLLAYLKPKTFQLCVVFVLAILATVFMVVSPKILAEATNTIASGVLAQLSGTGTIDFQALYRILYTLAGFYIFSAFFNYLMQYLMADVAQQTIYRLRQQVNAKLSCLPLKYFDTHTHGDLLSIVTNDIDNISTTLQQSLIQMITSVISLIGVTLMMFSISPLLTFIVFITLPTGIFIIRPIIKRSQKFFSAQQSELGALNGHIEEMYSGHTIVKAYGHEPDAIATFKTINDALYHSGWKAQFMSGLIMPLMNLVNNLGYVVIAVVGGILAINNRLSIGGIQAFIQYSRLFTQPINQLANIANILQSTVASAERVFDMLDEEEMIPEALHPQTLPSPKGHVSFEHVQFGYHEDKLLMNDLCIDVLPGQTVAIVGPTGAGKTTLINLLMRFYEVNGGTIKVDGVPITSLTRHHLRELFGMVLQDTWLFKGTVFENIAYGKENATFEEVVAAAQAAHAHHFIRTLPQGYDTLLNEEASNISQGQRQLLTIARAILSNPTILILDEATSSVDTRTESYIQNAMTRLMKGRTNFVIAHRLSTIKDADMILVMKDGNVVEKGNHQSLLDLGGMYAELYNSQFNTAR